MKHLGTNKELNTVIVELTTDDLQAIMACVNAAEIRWAEKGPNFAPALEEAHKKWYELYEISVRLR